MKLYFYERPLIGAAAVFRRYQKDDVFHIIDFIKKSPGSDSIPPCFRVKAFQSFYIGSKMRVLSQLRINELNQLLGDLRLAGQSNLL